MSDCTITLPVTTDNDEAFVAKVHAMVQKAGGTINGNTEGNFSIASPMGNISGNYNISNRTLVVNITDKPFLISCGAIKGILESQIQ